MTDVNLEKSRSRAESAQLTRRLAGLWVCAALAGCAHGEVASSTTTPPTTQREEAEQLVSQCEGQAVLTPAEPESTPDPLDCSDVGADADQRGATEGAPPTTVAACRARPREERASCLARVRALGRAAAPLRRARAAQRSEDWPTALDEFEAALELATVAGEEDPGVLSELAWARFLARGWCERTQDLEDLRYESEATGEESSPVAVLCLSRVALGETREMLLRAQTADTSRERRATRLYNLGRVTAALGQPIAAAEYLRQSLCLRDNRTVREHYAAELWRAGDSESGVDPDQARRYYRQSLVVLADEARAGVLADIEAARAAGFELRAVERVEPVIYPNMADLCEALLADVSGAPRGDDEVVPDCAVESWERVEGPSEPAWSAGVLRLDSAESYDGFTAGYYLLARIPAGVLVLLELGRERGDSRMENAYVAMHALSPVVGGPRSLLHVGWDAGEAYADGCDWETTAFAHLSLCGWDGRRPRCFARAVLGPVDYESDTMLGTVQESLGQCDYDTLVSPGRRPAAYGKRFEVEVSGHELVLSDPETGETTCLPLRESLCALESRPAVGCPATPGGAAQPDVAIVPPV